MKPSIKEKYSYLRSDVLGTCKYTALISTYHLRWPTQPGTTLTAPTQCLPMPVRKPLPNSDANLDKYYKSRAANSGIGSINSTDGWLRDQFLGSGPQCVGGGQSIRNGWAALTLSPSPWYKLRQEPTQMHICVIVHQDRLRDVYVALIWFAQSLILPPGPLQKSSLIQSFLQTI